MRGIAPWILLLLGGLVVTAGFGYHYYQQQKRMEVINKYSRLAGVNDIVPRAFLYQVMNMSYGNISEEEKDWLLRMREEEKMARDVYLYFYEKYGLQIFRNIANSEQNHMDAVKILLEKYNISDPVEETGDQRGVFKDEEIQKLYNELISMGEKSIVDALKVGALIEEVDIEDLKIAISKTDNEDIKFVYQNLMEGSKNHLRGFTRILSAYGVKYEPQKLSYEEYQEIVSEDWTVVGRGMGRGGPKMPR